MLVEFYRHMGDLGDCRADSPSCVVLKLEGLFFLGGDDLVIKLSQKDTRLNKVLKRHLVRVCQTLSHQEGCFFDKLSVLHVDLL